MKQSLALAISLCVHSLSAAGANLSLPVRGSAKALPRIGFGTSGRPSASGPALVASIKAYIRLGGRAIDTAYLYGNHKDVAQAIRESHVARDELWLTSKLTTGFGPLDRNHIGAPLQQAKSGQDAARMVQESLEQLGVDYLDLMLLHRPSDEGPALDVELWRALIDAQKSGKVKSIGVSQYEIHHIQHLHNSTGVLPSVNQILYHPWLPERAHKLVAWCHEYDIVVTAFHSIKGAKEHAALVAELAEKHHVTQSQILLRWALQRGVVVIPGATSESHIRENLMIDSDGIQLDFSLDDDDLARFQASNAQNMQPTVEFRNASPERVRVFWLENDVRRPVGELAPGERNMQRSSGGHRFEVQSLDGRVLGSYTVAPEGENLFQVGGGADEL